ncbi:MAG: hypothetical protein ACOC7N_02850 [Chloroflexota bacterium]
MCEHYVHHSHHGHCAPVAHSGCCCGPTVGTAAVPGRQHFPTREERIAQLEEYVRGLEEEAEAVKERIAALKTAE